MGSDLILHSCNFINCSAKYGAVAVMVGGDLSINNSNFSNNFATDKGIFYTIVLNNLTINNSTFNNNQANHSQKDDYSSENRIIYTLFNPISVNNSKFINNKFNVIYSMNVI